MHLNVTRASSLAVFAAVLCIAAMCTNGQPVNSNCCTKVSTREINIPITGFLLQKARPPCVNAVIFFTSEGTKCSHWRETWVQEKIKELQLLQEVEKGHRTNITATITRKQP